MGSRDLRCGCWYGHARDQPGAGSTALADSSGGRARTPFAKINGLEPCYEVTDFTHPWEGYSIEIMASDVRGLLDHLCIDRVHVRRVSVGGMVLLQFAVVYDYVSFWGAIDTQRILPFGSPEEVRKDMVAQFGAEHPVFG